MIGGKYAFIGFLDFGEGVSDGIFVVHILRTDFEGTSTALKSERRASRLYSQDEIDHFSHCCGFILFVALNPFYDSRIQSNVVIQ